MFKSPISDQFEIDKQVAIGPAISELVDDNDVVTQLLFKREANDYGPLQRLKMQVTGSVSTLMGDAKSGFSIDDLA
jgi:hypothetical protein